MKHLTVISYTREMSNLFEPIALKASTFDQHHVQRCQEVADLYGVVLKAGRRQVTLLDLVGHGGTFRFRLGDELFVDGPGTLPDKALKGLDEILHPKAVVRLVGCLTGVGAEGQAMIQSISKALSGRVVYGMTDRIEPQHFEKYGLRDDYRRMVSSKHGGVAPPELKVPTGSVSGGENEVEAGRSWLKHFPPGYKSLGRGEPLALVDYSTWLEKVKITFACDRRLVLIEDKPARPPLLLGWNSAAPVPPFHPQLRDPGAGEDDAHREAVPASGRSTQRRPIPKSKRRGGR